MKGHIGFTLLASALLISIAGIWIGSVNPNIHPPKSSADGRTFLVAELAGRKIADQKHSPADTENLEEEEQPLYESDNMTVSGTLTQIKYMVSEFEGTAFILTLDEPIYRTVYSDFWGCIGENIEIKQIQIVFSYPYEYIENCLVGNHMEVTGEVMVGFNQHHLTTILLLDAAVSDKKRDALGHLFFYRNEFGFYLYFPVSFAGLHLAA